MKVWPRYYVKDMGGGLIAGSVRPFPEPCDHVICTSCGVALLDDDGCGSHYCFSPAEGYCTPCRDRIRPPRRVPQWKRRLIWPVQVTVDRVHWWFAERYGKKIHVE